jgi:non-ribosomal peptide synthetase component F
VAMPLLLIVFGGGALALWVHFRGPQPVQQPVNPGVPPVNPSTGSPVPAPTKSATSVPVAKLPVSVTETITNTPIALNNAENVTCAAANTWYNSVIGGVLKDLGATAFQASITQQWNTLTCSQKSQIVLLGPVALNTLAVQFLAGTPVGKIVSGLLSGAADAATAGYHAVQSAANGASNVVSKNTESISSAGEAVGNAIKGL